MLLIVCFMTVEHTQFVFFFSETLGKTRLSHGTSSPSPRYDIAWDASHLAKKETKMVGLLPLVFISAGNCSEMHVQVCFWSFAEM